MPKDKKYMIEKLYDMASQHDEETGITSFDERKLKDRFKHNKKLFAWNKEIFRENEPKFHTCPRYNPCPLCDKCLNKASHLYVACQTCQIPICVHKYSDRVRMLRRNNFVINVPGNVKNILRDLKKRVLGD